MAMLSIFRMSSSHSGLTSRSASAMRMAAGNWKWACPSTSSSRSQPTASRIARSGPIASSMSAAPMSPGPPSIAARSNGHTFSAEYPSPTSSLASAAGSCSACQVSASGPGSPIDPMPGQPCRPLPAP